MVLEVLGALFYGAIGKSFGWASALMALLPDSVFGINWKHHATLAITVVALIGSIPTIFFVFRFISIVRWLARKLWRPLLDFVTVAFGLFCIYCVIHAVGITTIKSTVGAALNAFVDPAVFNSLVDNTKHLIKNVTA
jgi:hypothetical protein